MWHQVDNLKKTQVDGYRRNNNRHSVEDLQIRFQVGVGGQSEEDAGGQRQQDLQNMFDVLSVLTLKGTVSRDRLSSYL